MPSGSIPHGHERPDANKRHAEQADNSDPSYEMALSRATAAPFIVFPSAALLDGRMTHREMRVLLAMCWHANRNHLVWCKQSTIAAELNMARPHVTESIRALIRLGYIEIVRKAYRGADNPALRTNKYRVIWQASQEIDDDPDPEMTRSSSIGTPSGTFIGTAPVHHRYRSGTQNNTSEQDQEELSSSEVSYLSTSLAQSAELPAASRPPAVQAPPERRTRESFNPAALKRDPLYLALIDYLPEPSSPGAWRQWGEMISRLHRAGASAADIPTAVKGHQLLMPKALMTLPSIERHWSEIREGKTREQLQLAVSRRNKALREATAQPDRERQRELARLERERTEREWANELG